MIVSINAGKHQTKFSTHNLQEKKKKLGKIETEELSQLYKEHLQKTYC